LPDLPPRWQQLAHLGAGKSVVHEDDHTPVVGPADHAPGGLYHFLQTREQVRVVVTSTETALQPCSQLFVQRVHLGQAQRGDEGADEPLPRQIDALTKCPAQHREADALAALGEARHKGVAIRLRHAARLRPHRNVRVRGFETRQHLLQIVKAAEERQVVARQGTVLCGHHSDHIAQ